MKVPYGVVLPELSVLRSRPMASAMFVTIALKRGIIER